MPGDIQLRMPSDLAVPYRFFGLLSTADLLRVTLPPVLVFALVFPPQTGTDIGLVLTALMLGGLWATVTVADQPVDTYLRYRVQWLLHAYADLDVRDGPVRIRHQRILERADGTLLGILEVTPTNLELHSYDEQEALHSIYEAVIDQATYPVYIHSRQHPVDLEPYTAQIADRDVDTDQQRQLQATYTAYCNQLGHRGVVDTQHYIVLRVPPRGASGDESLVAAITAAFTDTARVESLTEFLPAALRSSSSDDQDAAGDVTAARVAEVDRRCHEVQQAVSRGPLDAARLTGTDLQEVCRSFHTALPTPTPDWADTPDPATESDKAGSTEQYERSNPASEYRHVIATTDYPSTLPLGWPTAALHADGPVDITQVITPAPADTATQQLRRTVEKLEAEHSSHTEAGYGGGHTYTSRLSDAEWMLDRLANRDTTACRYACYLTAHHPDPEQCRDTTTQITTVLRQLGVDHTTLTYQTPAAYQAQSPFHGDAVDATVLMPSLSAAAGFPFTATTIQTATGIVTGTTADGTPLLLDRFQWPSHSMVRMGTTGSGKTYATKLALLRSWLAYPALQIIILDPKDEYDGITATLNGQSYTIGDDQYRFIHDVVRLTSPRRGAETSELVPMLNTAVQDVYDHVAQTDRKTLVVVDEAHRLLHEPTGCQTVSTFVREARDTETGVTLVTQNAADFTATQDGRAILDNVPGKVFHRHERVPASVAEYFQLSDRERQDLLTLADGTDAGYSEALIKVSGRVDAQVRVQATATEHRVITNTNQGEQ